MDAARGALQLRIEPPCPQLDPRFQLLPQGSGRLTIPAEITLDRSHEYHVHFELPRHESSTRLLRLEASDLAMASSLVGGLLAAATDESSAVAHDLVPDSLHVVLLPLADGREEASAAMDPDSDCVPAQHGQVPVTFLNTNGSGYSEVTVFIDGEEIVQLERRRFISIELEPGMHTLGLLHRDLIPFRDDYEITISPAATFIEGYSALTSTRYRLNDLPPADVAGVGDTHPRD